MVEQAVKGKHVRGRALPVYSPAGWCWALRRDCPLNRGVDGWALLKASYWVNLLSDSMPTPSAPSPSIMPVHNLHFLLLLCGPVYARVVIVFLSPLFFFCQTSFAIVAKGFGSHSILRRSGLSSDIERVSRVTRSAFSAWSRHKWTSRCSRSRTSRTTGLEQISHSTTQGRFPQRDGVQRSDAQRPLFLFIWRQEKCWMLRPGSLECGTGTCSPTPSSPDEWHLHRGLGESCLCKQQVKLASSPKVILCSTPSDELMSGMVSYWLYRVVLINSSMVMSKTK